MVNAPSTKIWTGRHWNGWNVWNVPCVNFSEAILNFGVLLDALLMLGKTCALGVHEWKAQLEEVCHVQSQLILRLEVPKKTHFWCADEVDDMLNKMGVNGMSSSMLDALKKGTSEEDLKKALAEQAGRSLVAAIFCSWCLTPVWLTGVTGWWMIHFDSNKTCFQVWFSGHYQQPWVLVMFFGPEYARKNLTSWRFFCFSSFSEMDLQRNGEKTGTLCPWLLFLKN